MYPTLPYWVDWGPILVAVVASYLVANVIIVCSKYRQNQRIGQKTQDLALSSSSMKSPVPVTIITGYLGVGKTTLFNNILRSSQHKRRILALVNEFGDAAIDHQLLV